MRLVTKQGFLIENHHFGGVCIQDLLRNEMYLYSQFYHKWTLRSYKFIVKLQLYQKKHVRKLSAHVLSALTASRVTVDFFLLQNKKKLTITLELELKSTQHFGTLFQK